MAREDRAAHELESRPWVGVDLGGSGARLWSVAREPASGEWCTQGPGTVFEWEESDWEPLPLVAQVADRGSPPGPEERREAVRRIERLVLALDPYLVGGRVGVAIAAAGLRCADERGLEVVRNGPRMPDLVDTLEERLALAGCSLTGDGLAGAVGERESRGGALAGVTNALYLGGGTGLAEAQVVGGEVREFGDAWPRAWELELEGGQSLEDSLAPHRMGLDPELVHAGGGLRLDRVVRRLRVYVERRRGEYERMHGIPLERLVVAQGLARILAGTELPREDWARIVVISSLRAAPALGAVALAARAQGGPHA